MMMFGAQWGKTYRAMKEAPQAATWIVADKTARRQLRKLAKDIGRQDIKFCLVSQIKNGGEISICSLIIEKDEGEA